MIHKYLSKPVIIEAIKYDGENKKECIDFMRDKLLDDDFTVSVNFPTIKTLEGLMEISVNDFIIKGTHGEFYPCKPEIFETKYNIYFPAFSNE